MTRTNERRVALVTGGAIGIGRAISERLFRDGLRVAVLSRNPEAWSKDDSEDFLRLTGDISRLDQIEHSVKKLIERFGVDSIDVLVNNAGVAGPIAPIQEVGLEEWNQTMAVNVTGAFLLCKTVVPLMIKSKRPGRIVNIVSMVGKRAAPFRASYSASKMALLGLTRSLSAELGKYNITVNAVSPGAVEGERMDYVIEKGAKLRKMDPKKLREGFIRRSSIGRFSKPEEIAALVSFLVSTEAANVTGQDFCADSD